MPSPAEHVKPGKPDERQIAFIRALFWATCRYNIDDWRTSRWWLWILPEIGR